MLDRLPPEIIDRILLEAAPPPTPHDLDSRWVGQHTLATCCRVCRLLRARAQPLLWRDVVLYNWWVKPVERLTELLWQGDVGYFWDEDYGELRQQSVQALKAGMRSFAFDSCTYFSASGLGKVLVLLASLPPSVERVDLQLRGNDPDREPFRLGALGAATFCLHHLGIYNLDLCDTAASLPSLPALVHLSIRGITASSQAWSTLFTAATLPCLRYLHLSEIYSSDFAQDILTASFLTQLDLFQVEVVDAVDFPAEFFSAPFAFGLSWHHMEDSSKVSSFITQYQLRNLHIIIPDDYPLCSSSRFGGTVHDVADAFLPLPCPRALHLPHAHSSYCQSSPERLTGCQSSLSTLTTAAAKNGVKVFDTDEDVWDVVKRMKAEKEKGEEEEHKLEEEK